MESEIYLVERIRGALAQDPGVAELGITVTVVGARIILSGIVATAERRDAIATLVRTVVPTHEVQNDVGVQELATTGEEESL